MQTKTMKPEPKIEHLRQKKLEYEQLMETQRNKVNFKFEPNLEDVFWKDREDRLIKMIIRAIVPAILFFVIFEVVSLPINYMTIEPQYRVHDIVLMMFSYLAGWIALIIIFVMVKRPEWYRYYSQVVAITVCFTLTIVQSLLLSTQSLAMTWRGSLIIAFATIFAYLCSGLRPRLTFIYSSIASCLTCMYLIFNNVKLPVWVVTNTLLLSNLVGLALSTLSVSTERVRFIQSKIIEYDKQIYAILNQHFINLSQQDSLTLLGNRRGFEQHLMEVIHHAKKSKQTCALLFIDVDFFKLYNDLYGHNKGDSALIAVAQTLVNSIYDDDLAIRFGGEEFVVLLKKTDLDHAVYVAQHILEEISAKKIPHENSTISKFLTVSIGLSTYSGDGQINYSDLLRQADQALYMAKSLGRNQYKIYDPDEFGTMSMRMNMGNY